MDVHELIEIIYLKSLAYVVSDIQLNHYSQLLTCSFILRAVDGNDTQAVEQRIDLLFRLFTTVFVHDIPQFCGHATFDLTFILWYRLARSHKHHFAMLTDAVAEFSGSSSFFLT